MNFEVNGRGHNYWRSLNELAQTEEFREFLHREFPEGASELNDSMSRRKFLSLMGASIAFAGLANCRKPVEKIIPYVEQPEEVLPGVPNYYATAMPFQNSAYGILVESHEGRPTKIEGNELHPSSRGKANVFMQSALLNLYDPDRSGQVLRHGAQRKFSDFVSTWRRLYTQYLDNQGEGLAVVSEAFASPTLERLRDRFLETFPNARWIVYEPVSDENISQGIDGATGGSYFPVYRYEHANVVVALDADFLHAEQENVSNARDFAGARRVETEDDSMNRLYAVEGRYTVTGGMADHRLQIRSSQIGAFTLALVNELRRQGLNIPAADGLQLTDASFDSTWLAAAAGDLMANQGASVLVAGRNQPPVVHALVYAVNAALGNTGETVWYRSAQGDARSEIAALRDLVAEMESGTVETLWILGGNPVYNAPANLEFGYALTHVEHSFHLSSHVDETSEAVEWHIPEAHFLESWGDTRAVDGTLSVVQPLIAPLFQGHPRTGIFHLMATGEEASDYDVVRETWRGIFTGANFERQWRQVVHDGVLRNSAAEPESPEPQHTAIRRLIENYTPSADTASINNLEIAFQASPSVHDGRFANNGWLQELPDTVTKLTWDNAAVMSPRTAGELGVQNEEIVALSYGGRELEAPVWIVPGIADYMIVLELGYGREAAGRVGNAAGFNAYPLRSSQQFSFGLGGTISKTGGRYKLASTQDHWSMEERPLLLEATMQEYREHPEFAREAVEHPDLDPLWEEHSYEEGYQWGMAIDLNVCTGCNACTIACQSENNIPVVGKDLVAQGREMHWIRVDRYFAGTPAEPDMVVQPVTCMHCENAPCETVCPVNATVHDDEGLNVQVYNRCIGTRYCSNNCPYKVRRFNFFNYTHDTPEVQKIGKNPDVTVRSRGVMEKCTYCLQRINRKKILAKREDRRLQSDEVVSACQQTCPTDAIVFGDINDPESRVSQVKRQNRDYAMLVQLGTKPRTTYQAKLRNPNPMLEDRRVVSGEST